MKREVDLGDQVFDDVVQRIPDEFSENKDKEYETKFLERWRHGL